MDVRLSAEQVALRDAAVALVDRLGVSAVGELDDGERGAKLDAAVDGAGWRELRVALDDGTPLASGVEVGIVAEELARGSADTAFLGPTLAAELRRLAGAPPASTIETVVLAPDLSAIVRVVDVAVPNGALAVDARGSSSALVLAQGDGGYTLGAVAVGDTAAGVDLTRPVAATGGQEVVPVPGQARLIDDHDLAHWTALGLAVACADLVGTMRGAVRLACDYASARQQYGVPVGSFQAVQHLLADAFVATEGARSLALHAAWAVDTRRADDALAAASAAKAYASRAARAVCETAIQVHGGIGNTWECMAHVHLRRALFSIDVLGGVGVSLARVLEHEGIEVPSESERAPASAGETSEGVANGLR